MNVKRIFRFQSGFFLLAFFTGLLVGVSTVLLIECISALQDVVFARYGADKIGWLAAKSDWSVFVAPVLGGVIVGVLLRNIPGHRFHGIADVMEASSMRAGRMDVRTGGVAALATWVSLGSGAPLGREGPAVHIGASLTAWLAEWLDLERSQAITLLGCAAAAAVTASFNTPIAGVLFALEVIVGYYSLRVFAPVVIAAMGAVIIRHSVYGNVAEFSLPDFTIGSLWELAAFALLGFAAALVVQLFIFLVIGTQWIWKKSRIPLFARPGIAGIFIGTLALNYPLSLGVGYEGTSLALNEGLPIALITALLLAKVLGGAIAIGSGFCGGVFSPALFIGAMLGAVFWFVIETIAPAHASSQGVYSVVGMAAVASAMLGAPISTLLIVFELTIDYDLVIAVMLASAMASNLMQVLPYASFFRWQLKKRGINLRTGRDQSLMLTRNIDDLVLKNYTVVSPVATLAEVEANMLSSRCNVAMIINADGEFCGSISTDDMLGRTLTGSSSDRQSPVDGSPHSIPQSTSLLAAQQVFNELDKGYAAVVKTGENGVEVVGVIHKSDVLKALYELMRTARSEERGVH